MPTLTSSPPPPQPQQFKFQPPSREKSFLYLPGTFEYLLTGQTARRRLPDDLLGGPIASAKNVILILIDGWGWAKAFDPDLPLFSRLMKHPSTVVRQMDSAFPTTTAAMLPSLYLGE